MDREKLKQFANSGDPDQTPRSVASDLGLHCLQIILLGVSTTMGKYIQYNRSTVLNDLKKLYVYSIIDQRS